MKYGWAIEGHIFKFNQGLLFKDIWSMKKNFNLKNIFQSKLTQHLQVIWKTSNFVRGKKKKKKKKSIYFETYFKKFFFFWLFEN